ncbi:protein translocase subunit SecF [Catenuloplanes atrovinosus]|uniref:Protein-export membrane protein SecF n=1 Tax=Catenuloplanes atrovinosus TaxID=137266 RepID=A0AAE4C7P7_9ACTN|nr:protein translocase subunit SecF [Catenuloplanes atrovinosus]MDR7274108.1 preprotein translocase subunit SecF [Catenuloplanes atrovinosus]
MAAKEGLASRLYKGEAGLNIIARRRMWFVVAAIGVLIAVGSFALRGFTLGIEFTGGTEFQVPAAGVTIPEASDAVAKAIEAADPGDEIKVESSQQVGDAATGTILIRTGEVSAEDSIEIKNSVAGTLGVDPALVSNSQVSGAWGASVTERAVLALLVFIAVVSLYLVLRFEWRMAVAAVVSLLLDLVLTAGVYSIVGFEVSPSTVIGFLTILGYALYDVVVVFDKVQENTRGITAGSNQTYAEAANLAINQTLMRSINTSLVALLPVGGLLFIGAGLLGAGTLEDLGLVLFVGMALAIYSSLFFATPVLVALKDFEPRIKVHNQRVLSRRAALANRAAEGGAETAAGESEHALAGSTPRVGARPNTKRQNAGNRGGRPGSTGAKRRG